MPCSHVSQQWQPFHQFCFIQNRLYVNSSSPEQNGRHFADDMFKRIFLNENIWISNLISLKYVPWGQIDNMSVLDQIIVCRLDGWASSPTRICGTWGRWVNHYGDVIMGTEASQITSLTIVSSTVYSDADQRKHHSSAALAFVRGIHRGPVNSPHILPVTRKMFPFDDVIMKLPHTGYLNTQMYKKISDQAVWRAPFQIMQKR